MRSKPVMQATLKRLVNPRYWGLILFFCLLWFLLAVALNPRDHVLQHAIPPIHLWFVALMLGPIPWQWSGDDRNLPSFTRGLMQAVVWNAVLILGAMMLSAANPPKTPPSRVAPFVVPARAGFPLRNNRTGGPSVPGYLTLMAGLLAGWVVANRERAEDGERKAVEAAQVARMHVLQSQMNPHVLFNIISGLCEMAREQPEAMERALLDLSAFLRELLDYSARNLASLSWERAMVERYLGLEQIRLGKRLRLSWDWDATLEAVELPPLLVQPLVENAIRHGIGPHRGGGELEIRLQGRDDQIILEVANTGAGLAPDHGEGMGLQNVRERLGYFQKSATLKLSQDGDWTRATLSLKRPS